MTDTVLLPAFVTYRRLPEGSAAIPTGFAPTATVASITPDGLIFMTVLLPLFATWMRKPAELFLTTTPSGRVPVAMVLMTVALATSMRVMLLLPELVT